MNAIRFNRTFLRISGSPLVRLSALEVNLITVKLVVNYFFGKQQPTFIFYPCENCGEELTIIADFTRHRLVT